MIVCVCGMVVQEVLEWVRFRCSHSVVLVFCHRLNFVSWWDCCVKGGLSTRNNGAATSGGVCGRAHAATLLHKKKKKRGGGKGQLWSVQVQMCAWWTQLAPKKKKADDHVWFPIRRRGALF